MIIPENASQGLSAVLKTWVLLQNDITLLQQKNSIWCARASLIRLVLLTSLLGYSSTLTGLSNYDELFVTVVSPSPEVIAVHREASGQMPCLSDLFNAQDFPVRSGGRWKSFCEQDKTVECHLAHVALNTTVDHARLSKLKSHRSPLKPLCLLFKALLPARVCISRIFSRFFTLPFRMVQGSFRAALLASLYRVRCSKQVIVVIST